VNRRRPSLILFGSGNYRKGVTSMVHGVDYLAKLVVVARQFG
jgi:hypothetical protein